MAQCGIPYNDRPDNPNHFFIHFVGDADALTDMRSVNRLMLSNPRPLCGAAHLCDLGCGTEDDARGLVEPVHEPGPRRGSRPRL